MVRENQVSGGSGQKVKENQVSGGDGELVGGRGSDQLLEAQVRQR